MGKHNLLKNSERLCNIANKILEKTNLIEIFSKIGKVEIIDSLRLQLMYRLDIDLLCISEKIEKSKAQQITNILLESNIFRSVILVDYKTFPGYDMPLGFYWELVYPL